jgi:hypothetical protein
MLESISLDIANCWITNNFLTEANERCGTLVAFDWRNEDDEYYLSEINTNIDLNKTECENFKFDTFVNFLKDNNFNHVLGLRNVAFEDNPSPVWTDKLKETLKSNSMDYDEYVVDEWPLRIPEFDVPDNIFILRYSYDEYSRVDQFASSQYLFEEFIEKSEWKSYYKDIVSIEKNRVIVFCNNIENLVLKDNFVK